MSAATSTEQVFRPAVTPDPAITAVPFSRLVRVEARKLVDTRAGFWLLVAIGAASIAVIALLLTFGGTRDLTFLNFLGATGTPLGVLLPVLGILAVTAEWSQRTGLITFTLEPRRGRTVAAKLAAALAAAVVFYAISLAAAAGATLLAEAAFDGPGSFDDVALISANVGILVAVSVVQGIAFGLLIMNTPAAIVAFFVLPTIWNILGTTVSWLEEPAEWLDLNQTTLALTTGNSLTSQEWSQLGASVAVWVLLPLLLGFVRLSRREVK